MIPTLKYSKYLEFFVLRKLDMYSTHSPLQKELSDIRPVLTCIPCTMPFYLNSGGNSNLSHWKLEEPTDLLTRDSKDILQELLKCF